MARTRAGGAAAAEFSARSRLKKAGGSLVLTVPAAARNMLGLAEGQEMIVSVRDGKVVAEPVAATGDEIRVRAPRYTLDALLADHDATVPRSDEERAWLDAPPAGNEIW